MPLTTAMRDLLGQLIIGGNTSAVFSNGNAFLCVGDSTQSFVSSQNSMGTSGASWDKSSQDGGYPVYSTSSGGPPAMIFRSTFSTAQANFHWQEWGVKNTNASTTGTSSGTLLNRVVADLGTKTNVQTWQLTATITPTT